MKREGSARRGQIEVAARPHGGARLRNIAERDLEASALARRKAQRLASAGKLKAHAVARIPQRRVAMLAMPAKAQAARAAAGEHPAVGPVPGRGQRRHVVRGALAQQHGGARRRHVERGDRPLRTGKRRELALDETGIDVAARHLGARQQRLQEREIGCHPRDLECAQRIAQARERLHAIFRPDDELREQRIVVGRDRIAGAKPRIHAHPFARRRAPLPDRPGRREKALVRILGIDARLDGVAVGPIASCASGSFSPNAMRNCHSTRSRPVIISVTGCSTCSRVFISMK